MGQEAKTIKRSDNWSKKHDDKLVRLVIDHIRTGKPQLEAFADFAKKNGRTSKAVAFRWNKILRKNYVTEIERAKAEHVAFKTGTPYNDPAPKAESDAVTSVHAVSESNLTFERVSEILTQVALVTPYIRELEGKIKSLQTKNIELQNDAQLSTEDNNRLLDENKRLQAELKDAQKKQQASERSEASLRKKLSQVCKVVG